MSKILLSCSIALLALFILKPVHGQTIPVIWDGLKLARVNGNILAKDGNGVGYATSRNLLYGKKSSGFNDGYFTYKITGTDELKKIGFAVINSEESTLNQIDYAFDIQKGGNMKLVAPNAGISANYALNGILKLSREGDKIRFYLNNNLLYEVSADPSQLLVIRSELKGKMASFTDVQTSIQTSFLDINASVNSTTKEISLIIDGLNGPYTYKWSDGDNSPNSKKLLEGTYEVVIMDNNGNEMFRQFSVGQNVIWGDFIETSATGNILSKIAGMKWGSAKSIGSSSISDNVWLEYIIEEQLDQKALGFSLKETGVKSFADVLAGYVISKDRQLQLVHEGTIVKTLDYFNRDVVRIQRKDNAFLWYLNGKLLWQTVSSEQELRIAGLVRGGSTLKNVQFSTKVNNEVVAVWDDSKDKGETLLDISSYGAPGPYQYFISEASIPELTVVYKELVSAFPEEQFDHAAFLSGKEVTTNKSFSGLDMGTYFVSVFDNYGQRIMQKEVTVHAPFTFEQQTNLHVNGTEITSTGQNALGSLELYATAKTDSEMAFEITSLTTDQYFGYAAASIELSGIQSIKFGFKLEQTNLYTVINGIKSDTYSTIDLDSEARISIRDQSIQLKINNEVLESKPLNPESEFKVSFGGIKPGIKGKPLGNLIKSPVKQIAYSLSNNSCNSSTANLTMVLPSIFGGSTVSYNVQLEDAAQNHVGAINQSIFSDLPIGIYRLIGTCTRGNQTHNVNIPIYVGVLYAPQTSEFLNEGLLENNVIGQGINLPTTDGESIGYNVIGASANGWISFSTVTVSGQNSFNSLLLSSTPQIGNQTGIASDPYIRFSSTQKYFIYNNPSVQSSVQVSYYLTSRPLTIRREGSNVYMDNGDQQILLSANYNINKWKPSFKITKEGSGFKGVIISHKCPEINYPYIKLERKMTGVKYQPFQNKVYFQYDEEYNNQTPNLNYKVFSTSNSIGPVLSGLQEIKPLEYGDNRYVLEVSNLPQGTYVLEVENEKGEKFYLRFIK